jgi:hypothetical protein
MKKQLLTLALFAASIVAQAQSPYPIRSVDSVQFVNQAKLQTPTANTLPDWIDPVFRDTIYRDTVRFEAVVVSNPAIYGLSTSRKAAYVQRIGGGPWSSVLVMCDHKPNNIPLPTSPTLAQLLAETKFYDNMVPGKLVRITGVISNFQGETQINLMRDNANYSNAVEQLSLNDTAIYWNEIKANDLMSGNPNTGWVQQKNTAEQWEGSPVIIKNVTVYSSSTFGTGGVRSNWNVIDDFGNVIDIRDMSGHLRRDGFSDSATLNVNDPARFTPPPIGTRLEYIRGIVTEYSVGGVQRYGIAPLYQSDYKVCTSCPPIVKFVERKPIVATINDTLSLTFEITVGDTTLKNQFLHYRRPGSNTIDSIAMTARPSYPNQYIGKVVPPNNAGILTYWVSATDKKERSTYFPDPLTLGRSILITNNGVDNIRVLQYSNTNSGSTIWDNDSLLNISVKGVVTTSDALGSYLTLQDGQGPNSAILVQRSAFFGTDTLLAGDSIEITRAKVRENFNVTTLFSIAYNKLKSGAQMPIFEMNLPLDSFINNRVAYARPFESVLVRFDSVKVVNTNPDGPTADFGEFSVYTQNQSTTNGLRVDDLSAGFKGLNHIVKTGTKMAFIQGPMYFANGNFKLIPRNFGDVDLSAVDQVAPVITLLGNNPDSVKRHTAYVEAGATALDNIDGNLTDSIMVTGTVDTATVGTYVITYAVKDAWGNPTTTTRNVIVYDSVTVGLNNNEFSAAQINLFPNPAHSVVNVSVNGIKTLPVHVAIFDVIGREVYSKTVNSNVVNERINMADLNSGVYFIKVSNAQGSKTMRFVVSGN